MRRDDLAMYNTLTARQKKLIQMKLMEQLQKKGQVGAGFFSNLIKGVKKLVTKTKKVPEKALEGIKNVGNKVTGCKNPVDKWVYKPKPGEKHTVVTKDGCFYRDRFAGPGTHVIDDVKELLKKYGDNISMAVKKENFPSDVSRLGMAHDIRYVLSYNSGFTKKEQDEYIKKADEKFIADGKKLPDKINAKAPTLGIQAKLKAENLKVKVPGFHRSAGKEEKNKPEDVQLLRDVLSHLEQLGFGRVKKDRPLRHKMEEPKVEGAGKKVKKEKVDKRKKGNGRKHTAWDLHMKEFWAENKGKMNYRDALKAGKLTYKK